MVSETNTISGSKNHYKITTQDAVCWNSYIVQNNWKAIIVKAAAIYEFINNLIPIALKSPMGLVK